MSSSHRYADMPLHKKSFSKKQMAALLQAASTGVC
jgi:hypothetical protein